KPTYYKASVQNGAFDAKFTNDGMTVDAGEGNGEVSIDLIIKGLPTGIHRLQTFHNSVDNLLPAERCPMDVYVNDNLIVDNLVPTARVEKMTEVAYAELQLDAVAGQDVVVSFRADMSGSQAAKSITINGFYLNAVDVSKLAREVEPKAGDEYLDVPQGG